MHLMYNLKILGDGSTLKFGGTIQRWFQIFRSKSEIFPKPYVIHRNTILLPLLLDNYPVFTRSLVKDIDYNLAYLLSEFVLSYVLETGIPSMLTER